jgi:uncharacterized repeat protein (TIGR01451 family)
MSWRRVGATGLVVFLAAAASGCVSPYARPQSSWSSEPTSITLEPVEATNPIRTQHTIRATVKDAEGNPVHSGLVEWTLARTPGAVGDIVSVTQDPWKRALKVDNTFALGGLDYNGQNSITITSVTEGITHIIAHVPGMTDPTKHKAFAIKNWLDAQWQFPPAATNKVGTKHSMKTTVMRASDGTPLEGYDVEWKVSGGPAATFEESGTDTAVTKTNDQGVATATLVQTAPEPGVNNVDIVISKQRDTTRVCCPTPYGVIAKGSTTKTWVAPTIAIQKTCPTSIAKGMSGDFTIVVSNTSQVEAENVIVKDVLPDGLAFVSANPAPGADGTWSLGNLAGGASQTITVTARGTRTGSVTNEVIATSGEGLEARSSCPVTITEPNVAIAKTCPAEGVVGETLNYTVTVRNPGTADATNVVVTDTVPEGMRHASGQPEVVWRIGDLVAGSSASETFPFVPDRAGTFTNVARVTADGGLSDEARCDTIIRQPALKISKSGRDRQVLGRNVTYSIVVSNPGSGAATNVVVSDQIPTGTSYVSSNPAGTVSGNTVSWNLGSLAAGAEQRIDVTLRGTAAGRHCDTVTAQATGLSERAEACTTWEGVPGVLTELVDDPDPVEVGTTSIYTITISNQGTAPLTNLKVVAKIPVGEEYVSHTAAPGTTGSPSGRATSGGPGTGITAEAHVDFSPYQVLNPGAKFTHTVTIRAVGIEGQDESDVRFIIELTGDQLTGPVVEEESTHLYR